ncbi:MAG: hypothetical protein ACYCX2_01985 [Christensenellales bacterium]
MDTKLLESVVVGCPKDKELVSSNYTGSSTNYSTGTVTSYYTEQYKIKNFNVPINVMESYEKEVECPHCGARLTLTVKTKGKMTDAMRQSVIREKQAEMKRRYTGLAVCSMLTVVFVLLGVFLMNVNINHLYWLVPASGLFVYVLFLIPGAIKMRKFIGHPERILEKYEEGNPYFVSLGSSDHFFTSLKGDQKTTLKWKNSPDLATYLLGLDNLKKPGGYLDDYK